MKTYKVSFLWLGLLSLIAFSCAFFIQIRFNQSSSFDFYINVILGIFGSSFVSALFVLISYFVEYQRLINEMTKSFALSMISLNQCCMANEKKPLYKIKKFNEWKSYHTNFYQFHAQFFPFFYNAGKARKITELHNLLTDLAEKLVTKEYYLETADLTEEKAISNIFNDIFAIKDEFKERINDFLKIYYPGVNLR